MSGIPAIETRWHGWHCRSRTEARWCVFFSALKIEFNYEPEGFLLCDGTRYLPDFYLPKIDMFAEVKPAAPTDKEFKKAILLSHGTGSSVLFLDGPPDFKLYEGATWDNGFYSRAKYTLDIDEHKRQFYNAGRLFADPEIITEGNCTTAYQMAIYASRSERFEEAA